LVAEERLRNRQSKLAQVAFLKKKALTVPSGLKICVSAKLFLHAAGSTGFATGCPFFAAIVVRGDFVISESGDSSYQSSCDEANDDLFHMIIF
jgi:hypothetical protein